MKVSLSVEARNIIADGVVFYWLNDQYFAGFGFFTGFAQDEMIGQWFAPATRWRVDNDRDQKPQVRDYNYKMRSNNLPVDAFMLQDCSESNFQSLLAMFIRDQTHRLELERTNNERTNTYGSCDRLRRPPVAELLRL
jgi:hypothetical protein